MWYFILIAVLVAAVASIIYLVSRFYKFGWVRKWGGERKLVRLLLAALPVILIIGAAWPIMGMLNVMIVLIHLMFIWLICDLINRWIEKLRKKPFQYYYAGILTLLVTAVYMGIGWYLDHNVWSTGYKVETEKAVGSLRIVQISDSHVGATFDGSGFAKWMEKVEEEKPDVVVVTGDFVDDDTSREDMEEACRALGGIKTTYGVYFVFGNHDKGYYGAEYRGYSDDELTEELERNGVRVLEDEVVLLDERFYIIGRRDPSDAYRGSLPLEMEALISQCDKDKYMIVLDHQPHDYENQEKSGVDLVLSGHTHGGQLLPFIRMGQWLGVDDKIYGLEKRGDTSFIVTSGISNWALKFKTGCKSEYVVIDVQERP